MAAYTQKMITFLNDDHGGESLEYLVVGAMLVLMTGTIVTTMQNSIQTIWTNVGTVINTIAAFFQA